MKKLILILLLCSLKSASQVTLETIWETPSSQINLYVVSQGYDAAAMGSFDSFATGFLNTLWGTTPYSTYKPQFRVILVRDVAAVNTYPRAFNQFNPPTTCPANTPSLANGSESPGDFYARMDQLIDDHIPGYNNNSYLIAIFNNQYYTGGGGRYTFATNYGGCNNNYMYHVLIHEFSHSFGLVGDEYQTNSAGVNPNDFPLFHNRNVTTISNRDDVPWAYLINPATPVPTCTAAVPGCTATVPGLYEGANYSPTGWYRPQNICKMQSVTASFCMACQDIITETIKKHLCNSNVTVNEDFISRHQYLMHWRKSVDVMASDSDIGNKISVTYLAQNAITLTPGFEAVSGSEFIAYTGDCSYIDLKNLYRMRQDNFFYGCTLKPGEDDTAASVQTVQSGLLQVAPNPASASISVYCRDCVISRIRIVSIDGKTVFDQPADANAAIDISTFAKGIYLITAQTREGNSLKSVFVKE